MAIDRNKIAQNLTAEQLDGFCERLACMKGVTLQKVADLAGEFGIEVSLMGAKSFRDSTYERYLEDLKTKREMAENISLAAKSGLSLSDAAASNLSQKIFDRLLNSGALTDEETNEMSLALSRLRIGDQRAKMLELKIEQQQFDAAKAVLEHLEDFKLIASDRGLNNEEKVAAVRARLWGAPPQKGDER